MATRGTLPVASPSDLFEQAERFTTPDAIELVDMGDAPQVGGQGGGFIANPPEQANWERFWEPMVALQSSYEFHARTLP